MCICEEIRDKAIESAQLRLDNGSDVQEVQTFIEYVNGETDLGRYEIVDGVILLLDDNG